jgi:thioredoxin 1
VIIGHFSSAGTGLSVGISPRSAAGPKGFAKLGADVLFPASPLPTVPHRIMAHPSIVTVSSHNFDGEVIASSTPVLVDFWAEWCGPCKMLSPVLDELATELGDKAKIAKVNIDDNQDLAVKFGIKSIPLLIFFKDGEVRDKVVGLVPKETLAQKLNALL